MKVLFDTNVIIQLEDINKMKAFDYSPIKKYCNLFNYDMFIHR
jgi:hypothetical protein